MKCESLSVDPNHPDPAVIARAARILREGGLVAFPTETVYGLGANALDPAAVEKIYEAKGRPARNPIIVHVADVEAARRLVTRWPAAAQRLAERFWPGPLTLVLEKNERVPDIVTAGGPTVAVRVPAHPTALALLRKCALPIAAPSANRSGALSPTRAEHVLRGLDCRIDLLLDAGPTSGGLESTVVDLTQVPPRLLRPGLVSPAQIEAVAGPIETIEKQPGRTEDALTSPGLLDRHYAPTTPMEVVLDGLLRVRELAGRRKRVGWVTFRKETDSAGVLARAMPEDADAYAARLYAVLHELDQSALDRIIVDQPPLAPEWLAVHDRLRRGSAPG